MTLAEAQTLRDTVLATIQTVATGGVVSYSINGRQVTKLDMSKLLEELHQIDALIDRLQYGTFGVVRFTPGAW